MPWNLSIAPTAPQKIVYKTDDDVSVHNAFVKLVEIATSKAPHETRMKRGVSTAIYRPTDLQNVETTPEVTLKQLMRLRNNTHAASLDVQVGLRGNELIFSARKREELVAPANNAVNVKKRGRTDEAESETSKRAKISVETGAENPSIGSQPREDETVLVPREKAQRLAQAFGLLREVSSNSRVVDTVLINLNESAVSQHNNSHEAPKVIVVVKLISGAALALNELYNLCSRYGIEDGLFTCRNLRQSNLSQIGTPTWRAAKAEGLVGATLLLNIT